MRTLLQRATMVSLIIILMLSESFGQLYDWRGPGRTGVYNESGLLKSWPDAGPKQLWEAEGLGFGYSSPTITPDAIYITGRIDENDVLTALTPDGKKKWDVVYGKAWIRNHTGTRSTPTFVDGMIYVVSGDGDIVCINTEGRIVWSKNHYEIYDSSPLMFGISESPLWVDGKILASPGGRKASVVAFDARTGDVVWEAEPLNESPQYVNPGLIVHNGRKMVVTNTSSHIIAIDPDDGKIVWKVNYDALNGGSSSRKNHATTPVYRDGRILIANGYDFIGVQLELSPDGSSVKTRWTSNDLDPHHGGLVLLGDYIYSSNYQSNSMGDWVCVDWESGKTMWTKRWYNKGSIIAADGMLYIFEEKSGHVGLVKPNPAGFNLVSEFRIEKGEGPYWAHPVIKEGKLFIRHGEILMVYDIKGE